MEQAIRDLCDFRVEGEGYRLSYRIASDNLELGISVVADSCNPIDLTRREWNAVAIEANVRFINIEVICSDREDHKQRVETRKSDIPGLNLPTWEQVKTRKYHPWHGRRITIDTAAASVHGCVEALLKRVSDDQNQSY